MRDERIAQWRQLAHEALTCPESEYPKKRKELLDLDQELRAEGVIPRKPE